MSEFSVTFLVLVNSKSGGQDGPHLLEKFTEIFREVSSFTPTLGAIKNETLRSS